MNFNINGFPIVQTYVINVFELAVFIEQTLGKFLKIKRDASDIPLKGGGYYPNTGLAIAGTYVSRLVAEFCSKQTGQVAHTFEESMLPYIKDEWHFVFDEEKKENVPHHELFTHLRGMLLDLRTDVKVFLGGDEWVMHSVYLQSSDIYVHKGVDFRIADWTRRMEEGEWKGGHVTMERELSANEQSLQDEQKHRAQERGNWGQI